MYTSPGLQTQHFCNSPQFQLITKKRYWNFQRFFEIKMLVIPLPSLSISENIFFFIKLCMLILCLHDMETVNSTLPRNVKVSFTIGKAPKFPRWYQPHIADVHEHGDSKAVRVCSWWMLVLVYMTVGECCIYKEELYLSLKSSHITRLFAKNVRQRERWRQKELNNDKEKLNGSIVVCVLKFP